MNNKSQSKLYKFSANSTKILKLDLYNIEDILSDFMKFFENSANLPTK